MRNIIRFPSSSAQVRREAAAWLVRLDGLDGAALSPQLESELRGWLAADSRHAQAVVDMAQLWDAMDCLSVLAELFPAAAPPPQRPAWRWMLYPGAVAGLASLAVVLTVYLLLFPREEVAAPHTVATHSSPQELVYRTGIGEQSEAVLADGSTMALNTDSEVRVSYSKRERTLYLTRGEAFFTVAKNAHVPFVVHAGRGKVRALGTAFSVWVKQGVTEVMVQEGTVAVEVGAVAMPPSPSASPLVEVETGRKSVTLGVGGSADYADTLQNVSQLSPEHLERRLAWREGKWLFTGETLEEVVREVSRYTLTDITIVDPRIADLRIGGYFDIGKLDEFLSVLQDGFGVSVTSVNDGLIQLSALDTSVAP
ncbi:FecR family protein [Pseudohalioglobus lutimaris]|nr:FecR domain-containing protein [Pseudohalioglobus lutimaris]